MTNVVALIPGLWAAIVAWRRSPARAYLDVYLPVLLLIPDYFRCILPVLPDPTPNAAAIVAIAVVCLLRGGARWRFSLTDGLVIAYAAAMTFSEYLNKDGAEARNIGFEVFAAVVLPYLLTKILIEPQGLRVEFAKRMVVLVAIVVGLSLWEFRMGRPVFKFMLAPLFPGQGSWPDTFRYGFTRVAGPYGHAILAGIIFAAVYRVAKWLEWTGHWPERVAWLPWKPTRARLLALALAAGSVMTLCRGPWIGAFAGMVVLLIGRARNRRRLFTAVLVLTFVVGLPGAIAFKSYVSVGRQGALTPEQETAAYRAELVEKYTAIAMQHAWWGWGRAGWPKVAGMDSTDNSYLLLALNHGLVTLGLFLAILASSAARLAVFGARRPRDDPSGMLAFTLLGCYVGFFISLATVFHGEQTVQLFFIVAGWSEGLMSSRAAVTAPVAVRDAAPGAPLFQFSRVMT